MKKSITLTRTGSPAHLHKTRVQAKKPGIKFPIHKIKTDRPPEMDEEQKDELRYRLGIMSPREEKKFLKA